MPSDLVEFVDAVESPQVTRREAGLTTARNVPLEVPRNRDHSVSDLVQWTKRGEYYVPSGPTQPFLPVGCYKFEMTDFGVCLLPTNMITDDLLRLPDANMDKILKGIDVFWESKHKFVARGQLFKRGVLLWGPAGAGKTSTVHLLAQSILKKEGIVILTVSPSITIDGLRRLRAVEPDRPIVNIIEDIDETMANFGESNLLSLLDGENQVENIVHVATTNFPERLGARFAKRPSRFDEIVKIDVPSKADRQFFLRSRIREDEMTDTEIERWVDDTESMSIAFLKELIVATFCLSRPYEETLEKLKAMTKRMKSTEEWSSGDMGFVGAK